MNDALILPAWNLVLCLPFALLAWCLCRVRAVRVRPALCHLIWMLVLLKLVTPPLISVPLLPRSAPMATGAPAVPASRPARGHELPADTVLPESADVDAGKAVNIAPAPLHPEDQPPQSRTSAFVVPAPSWHDAAIGLCAVSALVTLAIWIAALRQARRVRRLLAGDPENTDRISRLLHEASRRFSFKTAPQVYIVDAAITPLLWAQPGKPSIILPRQLTGAMDDDQLRHVIAHELAHYARCDHWSNLFGFAVASLCWWHPVAWFARREMCLAAEACCDAVVLEQFSGSRQAYARTLLTVVDFVNSGKVLQPIAAMTFGGSSSLQRRFQMLAISEIKSKVSWGGWLMLLLGSVALVLVPVRAQDARLGSQRITSAASKPASEIAVAEYVRPAANEQKATTGIPAEAWGEPVNGLRVAIVLQSPPVDRNEYLRYNIVAENVGDHDIRFGALMHYEYGFCTVELVDGDGEQVPRQQGHWHYFADPPRLIRFWLQPGERTVISSCLTALARLDATGQPAVPPIRSFSYHYFNLRPGQYSVSAAVELGPGMESVDPVSGRRTVLSPAAGEWRGKLQTGTAVVALPVMADDKPLPERWTLEYVPDKLPNLPDDLYGKTWGHLPPRSRTGRGHSDFLTFRKPADGKPAEVAWRQVTHPRVGLQNQETTRTLALRIEKSLLDFGGELRTAVVHDDILALNAGVPVDDRSWYLVESDTFTDGKVRVSEYLFEFDDDPRTADAGKVTVKHASNLFPDPRPEKWKQAATFEVDKKSAKYRTFVVRSIAAPGRPRSNLPKLLLWTDRPYLSLNESNHSVIEYRLQK